MFFYLGLAKRFNRQFSAINFLPPSPVPCIFVMIVTVGHEQQASDESKACRFESDGETAALALALALISCWLFRVPFLWKQTLPLEGAASIGPPARLGQRWRRSLCRPFSRCGLRAAGSCRVRWWTAAWPLSRSAVGVSASASVGGVARDFDSLEVRDG